MSIPYSLIFQFLNVPHICGTNLQVANLSGND